MERVLMIRNKLGLHARPAALFVQEASKYRSQISVLKDGIEVNGKSVMGLMLLAAEGGSKLVVKAEGPDAEQALAALEALFAKKFEEE